MFTYSPNIALNVKNHGEAVRFYRDVLGLACVGEHKSSDCSGTEMKAGPITLWLSDSGETSPAEAPSTGRVFFEFTVKNLEESRALLLRSGCQAGQKTGSSAEKFTGQMFTDPYGMRFHLYQPV